MSEIPRKKAVQIQDLIRQALYHDWDPIGVSGEAPTDEYDSYIAPVYRILVGSRSQAEIVEYLHNAGIVHIGVARAPKKDLDSVAEKLLGLTNVRIGT